MKIDSAQVGMESARLYRSTQSIRVSGAKSVSNSMQTGSQLTPFNNFIPQNMTQEKERDSEEDKPVTDEEANRQHALKIMGGIGTPSVIRPTGNSINKFQKLHEMAIRRLFEMLFKGRYGNDCQNIINSETGEGGADIRQFQVITLSKSMEYEYNEYEETSFSTQGVVHTADGRELNFNINVSMSRSFYEYTKTTHEESFLHAVDPLVFNLDTDVASISDQTFYFDLESNGSSQEYHSLNSASGFLALDKNLDGIINDGSELFGTKSGDGFRDLAAYDEDGNGWIDENDSIFDKLKIWVKSDDGKDILYGLKEKDIGAIYLGNVDTQFSLTASDALHADAIVRKSGFFLYEDGRAGTVQHVDLVS